MPATLEAGTIDGYSVGEPWNQAAVFKGIGVPVVTDYEIWPNRSEKVFGITAEFAEQYPNTTLADHQGAHPRRQVARRERQRQPR
jgi:nitrate/nitrite transport system substrate-binding protein